MTELPVWQVTNDLKVKGHAISVRRNSQLGYAKYGFLRKEKLASELGNILSLPVPKVEYGIVNQQQITISFVYDKNSVALQEKGDFSRTYNYAEIEALRSASGLLPFLLWIGADDHGDDTNLVIDKINSDQVRIRAIDFDDTLRWREGEEFFGPGSIPPGLRDHRDPALIKKTLAAINDVTATQIQACCMRASVAPESTQRLVKVLTNRQSLLCANLKRLGLLD